MSLNALKRRLIWAGNIDDAQRVERFQDRADRPYRLLSGAAAVLEITAYDELILSGTDASSHPNAQCLSLLIITGRDLMALVHELYGRAADEA